MRKHQWLPELDGCGPQSGDEAIGRGLRQSGRLRDWPGAARG
jgi:hypothetical protein